MLEQLLEQRQKDLLQIQQQYDEMLTQAKGDLIDKEKSKVKPMLRLFSIDYLEKSLQD